MADLYDQPVKQVRDLLGQSPGMINKGLARPLVFPDAPTDHR